MTSLSLSSSPLAEAVATHGRELAVVRRLVEAAAGDAVGLYKPWRRAPKGSALSAMTRDRFLELAQGSAELAGSGVVVKSCGEDWVRVWFPKLGWMVPLRTRPKVIRLEEPGLFPADLWGAPPGNPVIFWRWGKKEQRLTHFSLAQVTEMDDKYGTECVALENIEITAGVVPMHVSPIIDGAANDDDDLRDLVGRWGSDEPRSEDQVTDELDKDNRDDRTDPAMGEDGN
jgi:hypothetical protein